MAISVAQLVADPTLGLRVLGGHAGVSSVIAWAHTSELVDPTPWLSGGELLMTLGINMPMDAAAQRSYVERLAAAGVVGLAVDTGVVLDSVPLGLVRAGDAVGLPIVAVPEATPFLAISRAVINSVMADQVREVQRTSTAQEQLASAALLHGTTGLVEALGTALSAGVLLLDAQARPLDAAGPGIGRLQTRVKARLGALAARRGSDWASRANFTHMDDEGLITVQSLGAAPHVMGFLAIGSPHTFTANERLVIRHATTLLSIVLSKPSHLRDAEARLRRSVFRLLLHQGQATDTGMLRFFGFRPEDSVSVSVLADPGPTRVVEATVAERLSDQSVIFLCSPVRLGVAVLLPADGAAERTRDLQGVLQRALGRSVSGGVGNAVPLLDALESFRQASAAARVATTHPGDHVRFADLGVFDLLLGTQTRESLEAIVAAVLQPIEAAGGVDLLHTTSEFLLHNGHWESAAAALGVHRHTLHNRMNRVGKLLGRDMNRAHARAEVWMALRARELLSIRTVSVSELLDDLLTDPGGPETPPPPPTNPSTAGASGPAGGTTGGPANRPLQR